MTTEELQSELDSLVQRYGLRDHERKQIASCIAKAHEAQTARQRTKEAEILKRVIVGLNKTRRNSRVGKSGQIAPLDRTLIEEAVLLLIKSCPPFVAGSESEDARKGKRGKRSPVSRFLEAWQSKLKMEPPAGHFVRDIMERWNLDHIFFGMNRTREQLPNLNKRNAAEGKPAMSSNDVARYVWGVCRNEYGERARQFRKTVGRERTDTQDVIEI